MNFDIIEVTETYYESLSAAQRKILRTAQKKKNELERQADKRISVFRRKLYNNSVQNSALLEQKSLEIYSELEYETEVLKEQLLYDLSQYGSMVEKLDYNDAPYEVDFTLSYSERYQIVRDYYMAIPDPNERVNLYLQDEVAKVYLGRYYQSLYNVLLTYC